MNQTALLPQQNPAQLARLNDVMTQAGRAANHAAAGNVFAEHAARKADNTKRRMIADLALFESFLQSAGVPAVDLFHNPQAWQGVTWGIISAFKRWMLGEGYAIGSINARLSTVRKFAELATQAGAIDAGEGWKIKTVTGYAHKEIRNIDNARRADGIETRKGAKKAEAVTIPEDIAQAMTAPASTPQGKRDRLLMCLLLEHGLRVSEAAILTRGAFDLKAGTLSIYRPKVDITQTHTLTPATRDAAKAYLKHAPESGIIWRRSCKGSGRLSTQMSETSATRALTKRVELIGRLHGIEGLSAHDGRHYWATFEARNGTPLDRLMDAGGWASGAMPLRYVERAHIANSGTARIRQTERY